MYRIVTENVNRERTLKNISTLFDGFTVIPATGFYKGKQENSIIIEIETDNRVLVIALAKILQHSNKQESVMVQFLQTHNQFVRAEE